MNGGHRMRDKKVIAIIGAGIIGLSIAWQLARKGAKVSLFDQNIAGKGTSWVGAGMLAPFTECHINDKQLLAMNKASLKLYEQFLEELEIDTNIKIAINHAQTLFIALSDEQKAWLRHTYIHKQAMGYPVTWLNTNETRAIEPLLGPKILASILFQNEAEINNRLLISAMIQAVKNLGVTLNEFQTVSAITFTNGEVTGIQLETGQHFAARHVVVAAGAWSPDLHPLPIRPIKGQILTLKIQKKLRSKLMIRSNRAYLVSKDDGTLRLGATSEDVGFEQGCTVEGCWELLDEGRKIIPLIDKACIEEFSWGFRPVSEDALPVICPSKSIKNLHFACGHGRGGILQTPYTAYKLTNEIMNSMD